MGALLLASGTANASEAEHGRGGANARGRTTVATGVAQAAEALGKRAADSQTSTPTALSVEGFWYLGFGGATVRVDHWQFGVSTGFGRRSVWGNVALDWSFFNPTNYFQPSPHEHGGEFDGYILSVGRLGLDCYTDADANYSL